MDFGAKLDYFKQNNLYRQSVVADVNLLNFCSNDYLGMQNHPKVIEAFIKNAKTFGVGSGASHLVSGHKKPHFELEEYLAEITNCEKAVLFASGYMANLGIFSALKDDVNWVLQDKLNHASLLDANSLIGQKIARYQHNDINSLFDKLNKKQGFGLIATDTIFSMDGDIAKIDEIADLGNKHDTILLQDSAHSFGIYPQNIPKNSIFMATFGKAIGTYGAFVAGNSDFINYLVQKSKPYIYTTATPPALASATLQALKTIECEKPQQRLFANIKYFKSLIKTTSNTAIQPIIIGDNSKALFLSKYLKDNGFLVKAIRPPTVKSAILRITLSSSHTFGQIEKLAEVLSVKL